MWDHLQINIIFLFIFKSHLHHARKFEPTICSTMLHIYGEIVNKF
jgi:hypothetical protein